MRYAVVSAGVVVNVVLWDGVTPWEPVSGEPVACGDTVSIGWTYDGDTFADPNEVAPE